MDDRCQSCGSCVHRTILQGSTVDRIFAPALSIHSPYLLPISLLVSDYYRKVDEIAADTGSPKAKHMNRLFPYINPKTRKYYRLEEDPVLFLSSSTCCGCSHRRTPVLLCHKS